VGGTTGFFYSLSGICNERMEYPGKIITVPIVVKMEGKIILEIKCVGELL